MHIENIFCVGRNFANHAKEMKSDIPKWPMIFSKPTHSLVRADGGVIPFTSNQGEIHYETEIVLYIGKPVTDDFSVENVVTQMALGLDMTLRDIQTDLKKKGHPWLLAKGLKHGAIVTDFWTFPGVDVCEKVTFSLYKNNERVQNGNIQDLIFDFQTLLNYIHEYVGLNEGDIIFTGTPEGVGPIAHNDSFVLQWGNDVKGRFTVSM